MLATVIKWSIYSAVIWFCKYSWVYNLPNTLISYYTDVHGLKLYLFQNITFYVVAYDFIQNVYSLDYHLVYYYLNY